MQKLPINTEKAMCDGPTDQRTDRQTDGPTDGQSGLWSRVHATKKNCKQKFCILGESKKKNKIRIFRHERKILVCTGIVLMHISFEIFISENYFDYGTFFK